MINSRLWRDNFVEFEGTLVKVDGSLNVALVFEKILNRPCTRQQCGRCWRQCIAREPAIRRKGREEHVRYHREGDHCGEPNAGTWAFGTLSTFI